MHSKSSIVALSALLSSASARYMSVPPYPIASSSASEIPPSYPIATASGTGFSTITVTPSSGYPESTGGYPIGTAPGAEPAAISSSSSSSAGASSSPSSSTGTAPLGSGYPTPPISTGSPRAPNHAGKVSFKNSCPFVVYISTNATNALNTTTAINATNATNTPPPFGLGGANTKGEGQAAFSFDILDPSRTYGSARRTRAGADLETRRLGRGRGGTNGRLDGGSLNGTEEIAIDITVSQKEDIDGDYVGHIRYHAKAGEYNYTMSAPKGFLEAHPTVVDPVGEDCPDTEGWDRAQGSCGWGADMWVTFCRGYEEEQS